MKKILACLMCLIMTLCCSVTAFASELPYDGAEGSATVTYNVDSSYCVIIPETIDGIMPIKRSIDVAIKKLKLFLK